MADKFEFPGFVGLSAMQSLVFSFVLWTLGQVLGIFCLFLLVFWCNLFGFFLGVGSLALVLRFPLPCLRKLTLWLLKKKPPFVSITQYSRKIALILFDRIAGTTLWGVLVALFQTPLVGGFTAIQWVILKFTIRVLWTALGVIVFLFHLLPTLFTQYFNWIGLLTSVLLLYPILSDLWFALLGLVSHLVTDLRCKRFVFSWIILLGLFGFLTPHLLSPGPVIEGRSNFEAPLIADEGDAYSKRVPSEIATLGLVYDSLCSPVAFIEFSPAVLGVTQLEDSVSDAPVEGSMNANCKQLTVIRALASEKATRHATVDMLSSPTGTTSNVVPATLISAADYVVSEFVPATQLLSAECGLSTLESHCEKCEAGSFNSFMDNANCKPLTVMQALASEKATRHAPVDMLSSPTGTTSNVVPATLISAADYVVSEFVPVTQLLSAECGLSTFESHCEKCEAGSFNSFVDNANCKPLTVMQALASEKATRHAPVDMLSFPTGTTSNVVPATLISAADSCCF